MAGSGTGHAEPTGPIVIDPGAPYGYSREAALQQRFDTAAAALLSSDGWSGGGSKELVADLALEGGGVKGIGIVGAVSALAEAGYRFQRVAGTSAGAIAATLIAAISKKGDPMTTLQGYLDDLSFTEFMPQGKVHAFLDHHLGNAGEVLSSAEVLTHKMGVYDGDVPLHVARADSAGPRCAHLRGPEDHPGGGPRHEPPREPPLPAPRAHLGHHPGPARAPAVGLRPLRAGPRHPGCGRTRCGRPCPSPSSSSRSPSTALPAEVDIPSPSGGSLAHALRGWHGDLGRRRHAAELSIDAFEREDGAPPRWPTIGIKLSSLQTTFGADQAARPTRSGGPGLPAHHDGRVGRLQRRRRDGGPDHLRGQRRDLGH